MRRYVIEELCEMAIVQAEHDWNQIRRGIKWFADHYKGISIGVIGLPLLALILMELKCWFMVMEQNAQLDMLANMLK